MNLKKLALAASISSLIGLGVAGQAQASTYAGASLNIDNFSITISGVQAPPMFPSPISDFNFNITNTATLTPGGGAFTFGNCQGTVAANNCNAGPGNVLYSGPAEVNNAGAPHGTENFTLSDISGTDEYSRADGAIIDAQVVNMMPTHVSNLAETELQTATNGSATSNIDSTTDFLFVFSVMGPGTVLVEFDADPELIAEIDSANGASASASTTASIKLSNDTGDALTWTPTNVVAADAACAAEPGNISMSGTDITCSTQTVAENLNDSVSVGNIDRDTFSTGTGLQAYVIEMDFAVAGTYSLLLSETKTVTATTTGVPEPSSLALFGAGLAMFGFAARRKQKSKA